MFDGLLGELLRSALLVMPVTVTIALTIAAAGHYRGIGGAKVAATAIWLVAFAAVSMSSYASWAPVRSLIIVAILTTVCLALIFLPMKLTPGWKWAKGRLFLGLVGAAIAAAVLMPLALVLVCTTGVDCI